MSETETPTVNVEKVFAPSSGTKKEAPSTPVSDGPQTYALVKNHNTSELITLPDGSTFRFESALFVTTDKELFDRLLSASETYRICRRDLE